MWGPVAGLRAVSPLGPGREHPFKAGIEPRKELTSIVPRLAGTQENFVSPATLFANRKASTAVFKKYFKHGKTVVQKRKKKKKKKQ